MEERVGIRLFIPFFCTLEVFVRVQLSESHTKKIERNSMEFSRTASQNADHASPSDPLLLICFFYPGPSLILPVINMAMWGPVVERLCSEWTANPFWLDCLQVHCILPPSHSLIPFSLYPLVVFLPSQGSLLEHPSSPSILCKPSQTHSRCSHSEYISFDSPSYICDLPSIFTFSDVRPLTLYWELVFWGCFLPQEHIQRGELY